MSLSVHLSIHVLLAFLAGFIVSNITQKYLISFIFALLSGVGIDLDHFIDYFFAFGWHFKLSEFLSGAQFLKSDKIYILLHGWEYVIILILAFLLLKNRTARPILLALTLGLVFHLGADSVLNEGMKPSSYSIIYRFKNNFDSRRLVTPDHWQKQLINKKNLKLNGGI
ncbi:MAG TPA: hypothetical protein VK255_02825 [Patescibacteria group bacterium]|nr:hypothetical protein [Patescibacteria group bacterium]